MYIYEAKVLNSVTFISALLTSVNIRLYCIQLVPKNVTVTTLSKKGWEFLLFCFLHTADLKLAVVANFSEIDNLNF
jgi:hypothetical protein